MESKVRIKGTGNTVIIGQTSENTKVKQSWAMLPTFEHGQDIIVGTKPEHPIAYLERVSYNDEEGVEIVTIEQAIKAVTMAFEQSPKH